MCGIVVLRRKNDPAPAHLFCVLGTRPECVKMAPVIIALRRQNWARVTVISTGQHRDLIGQTLAIFGLAPDLDLDLMEPQQTLASLTARLLQGLDPLLAEHRPDLVLAQGDTTTVMATALACFYRGIRFGHVEAGLRTHDLRYPFPEEFNRVVAGHLASLHFAPTERARAALLRQGVPDETIHVTGNTVIDALLQVAARTDLSAEYPRHPGHRLVLLTAHRRENLGAPLRNICMAIRTLHARYPDVEFVYPLHPNPLIGQMVRPLLSGLERVHLIPAVGYLDMTSLLKRCLFVLTDSGGLQEEAPALGKPVLVLRDETERPEAIESGMARLVGTRPARIIREATRLLDHAAGPVGEPSRSPYGDGRAAERIAVHCARLLGRQAEGNLRRVPSLATLGPMEGLNMQDAAQRQGAAE